MRELAKRGVLHGESGAYESVADVGEAKVPATLQATIAARIDRLDPKAKRTPSAAAVIGSRFSRGLLETLGMIPPWRTCWGRAVAYELQLKSDRAQVHRRAAAAIEVYEPGIGRGERSADRRTSGGRL